MNQVTINKYSEMKHIAMNISRAMVELDDKCKYIYENNTSRKY